MLKQIITIDGELAIRILPKDKLKFGDIINIEKINKPKKKEAK